MAASARDHAADRAATSSAGRPVTAPSPVVESDLGRWKEFLREQEALCSQHGFPAAVLTVGLERDEDLPAATEALGGLLRSTDRAGVLCDNEIAVVLVPVESIHHAQRLVHMIDGGLRSKGLAPHVGWAMRLDGHGLFHASARADAAMLSSRGQGRPAVDLSDR
jgi:hypothetical protein